MASIVGASRQLSLLLIVAGTFDQVRGCTCPSSYPFCYDRWCYDSSGDYTWTSGLCGSGTGGSCTSSYVVRNTGSSYGSGGSSGSSYSSSSRRRSGSGGSSYSSGGGTYSDAADTLAQSSEDAEAAAEEASDAAVDAMCAAIADFGCKILPDCCGFVRKCEPIG